MKKGSRTLKIDNVALISSRERPKNMIVNHASLNQEESPSLIKKNGSEEFKTNQKYRSRKDQLKSHAQMEKIGKIRRRSSKIIH